MPAIQANPHYLRWYPVFVYCPLDCRLSIVDWWLMPPILSIVDWWPQSFHIPIPRFEDSMNRKRYSTSSLGSIVSRTFFIAWLIFNFERNRIRKARFRREMVWGGRFLIGLILDVRSPMRFKPRTLAGLPAERVKGGTSCEKYEHAPDMDILPTRTNWW